MPRKKSQKNQGIAGNWKELKSQRSIIIWAAIYLVVKPFVWPVWVAIDKSNGIPWNFQLTTNWFRATVESANLVEVWRVAHHFENVFDDIRILRVLGCIDYFFHFVKEIPHQFVFFTGNLNIPNSGVRKVACKYNSGACFKNNQELSFSDYSELLIG